MNAMRPVRRHPTPSVWLGLHTTEATGAVAVLRDGTLHSRALQSGGHHAASLLGVVAGELAALGAQARDLLGIAVTRGPGSFTGIRIGLATAQGLALAGDLPVAVCDSLEAEAAARPERGRIAVALDARRGEVYAGLFERPEADAVPMQRPRVVVPPFADTPGAARQRLLEAVAGAEALHVTGSGASLLVGDGADPSLRRLDASSRTRVAEALVRAAAAGCLPVRSARELEPLYLRKSDAELNREAGFGTR